MRILVCVDLSPLTERVIDEIGALAKATAASFTVLHAARTEPILSSGGAASPGGHLVPPADIAERRAKTDGILSRLREAGIDASGGVKLCDEVLSQFIVREAAAIGAAYILIGSHGHGRVFEMLLGSVTQGVIRDATIPVIVVPSRRSAGGPG